MGGWQNGTSFQAIKMPIFIFYIEKNNRSAKTTKPHIVSFPEKREASKVKKSWAPTFAVVPVRLLQNR